jgi:hypothetical protein
MDHRIDVLFIKQILQGILVPQIHVVKPQVLSGDLLHPVQCLFRGI